MNANVYLKFFSYKKRLASPTPIDRSFKLSKMLKRDDESVEKNVKVAQKLIDKNDIVYAHTRILGV